MTRIETVSDDIGTLVLSRKEEQKILIGGNILVQVIECRSDKVRLRIVAPKSVSIMRTEVLDKGAEPCKR